MLAPFTAGWQSTDLDPLVIAKSEVHIKKKKSFFFFFLINCDIFLSFLMFYREVMCMMPMGKSILTLSLVYGVLP